MRKNKVFAAILATIMIFGATLPAYAGIAFDEVTTPEQEETQADAPILFTAEELEEMAEEAPGHWETRSNMVLTNRHITDSELEEWIAEYAYLGANAFELEVIRLINIEREREGLAPLAVDNRLMMAARFKSQEMVDLNYFSHTSPVYGWASVIPITLFGTGRVVGENLAAGHPTPEIVVTGWMNSPGHRAAILREAAETIGIGRVGNLTTMMVGR